VNAASPRRIRAILLDIEGTTTPIAFVFDVLFPYARAHLRQHLATHAASPDYGSLIDRLRQEHAADRDAGQPVPAWDAAAYCEWLMDRDRKSTGLKELQGRIWEEGYRSGELVGATFGDVPGALERWHAQDLQIAIFSSGSVRAQHLLFGHSSAGDLTRYIRRYFDTTTGAKGDAESYRRIAHELTMPAESIVFVSDVLGELDAAREAGMDTRLSLRPGNKPLPGPHDHAEIRTFDALAALTE
jgi:enolase-phosphatase E1